MFKFFTVFWLLGSLLLLSKKNLAQTQLEFGLNSYPVPPAGPSAANISGEFLQNSAGTTFITYSPVITVSAAWSNQQYSGIAGMPPGADNGSTFGTTFNGSAKAAAGLPVWNTMGNLSSPSSSLFTSDPFGTAGTGIDIAANYGFNCFTTAEPQYAAATATTGRYYYSTLTLTFSRPVANPVLHITGLGERQGALGFSTELELQTAGITLDKLSGTGVLSVNANKILNSATTIDSTSGTSLATTGAASGSIRATGNNITSLAFKVYLRGDGGGANWSGAASWAGDAWVLGISMNVPVISSTVFRDINGLMGTPLNTVDGTGTNAGGQLFTSLVDDVGNVVLSSSVAADGTYIFQDILPAGYPDTYSIILSTVLGIAGTPAPAPSLPSGWVNTGEYLGTGAGNDGSANGILPFVTISNSSTVINNASFGIEQLPNSDPKLKTYASNTPGVIYSVPSLSGSDPEDGILGTGNNFVITTLPVNATLFYNGIAVTIGQIINGYTPALLKIDPLNSVFTTSFTYAAIDAAGKSDPSPATVTFNWSTVLPITLLDFTATKNGNTALLKWSTGQELNSNFAEIERSADADNFIAIGRLTMVGNSSSTIGYSFTDTKPLPVKNYYRLKFTGSDGNIHYSIVQYLLFGGNGTVSVYPNPVRSFINITMSETWINKPVSIEIYGSLGQQLLRKDISNALPTEMLDLHALPDALYILKLRQPDNNTTAFIKIQVKK